MISMGHGRAIIAIDDVEKQLEIYEKVIADNLSVRETENLIRSLKKPATKKVKKAELPNEYKKAQKHFSEHLQSKVEIRSEERRVGKECRSESETTHSTRKRESRR